GSAPLVPVAPRAGRALLHGARSGVLGSAAHAPAGRAHAGPAHRRRFRGRTAAAANARARPARDQGSALSPPGARLWNPAAQAGDTTAGRTAAARARSYCDHRPEMASSTTPRTT